MAARVNVEVDVSAIQGLFESYGQIGEFGIRMHKRAVEFARARVGKRTGALAASITGNGAAGTFRYTISVGSGKSYAGFVEDGTSGPILPKRGQWLAVGKDHGEKPIYKREVRGQRAQNYLKEGAEAALATEGIAIAF